MAVCRSLEKLVNHGPVVTKRRADIGTSLKKMGNVLQRLLTEKHIIRWEILVGRTLMAILLTVDEKIYRQRHKDPVLSRVRPNTR